MDRPRKLGMYPLIVDSRYALRTDIHIPTCVAMGICACIYIACNVRACPYASCTHESYRTFLKINFTQLGNVKQENDKYSYINIYIYMCIYGRGLQFITVMYYLDKDIKLNCRLILFIYVHAYRSRSYRI